MLKLEQVQSVYSGKPGCCCGCRGKHTYREDLVDQGQQLRGYSLSKSECNNRIVQRHINTINRALEEDPERVDITDDFVAYYTETRTYIAYRFKTGGVK